MDVVHKAFTEALESFSYLTEIDMATLANQLDKRLIDGLENGKAQKFEYTLELCWKKLSKRGTSLGTSQKMTIWF